MVENILIFAFSLVLLVKGSTLAIKYSSKLAENFNISRYVIGFMVVAFISILPETLVSINSALKGVPEFGLGTLLGSNIADLTLIFALLVLVSRRGIRLDSKILKNIKLFPFFLALPIIFGWNGHYSRIEGVALILSGCLFYYLVFKNDTETSLSFKKGDGKYVNLFFLILSMCMLLVGAHFIVTSATDIANFLKISPIIIGMLVVSLGVTIPEFFYSLEALKREEDGLAVGDIMGAVLADATIVIGILAFIKPFNFPVKIVYITGIFMVFASIVLLKFMRSGRKITRTEAIHLLVLWVVYALVEFIANT